MRKSEPVKQEINGNSEKYESYREAWARIKQAKDNDFFLEAITIQESIISDRLISFLSRPDTSDSFAKASAKAKKNGKSISFYNLIKYWDSEFPTGLKSGEYPDLINAVNEWRDARNAGPVFLNPNLFISQSDMNDSSIHSTIVFPSQSH